MKKKIAVIGSGISGISAAYILSSKYKIHLFEKNDYFGGHTRTLTIPEDNNIAIYVPNFIWTETVYLEKNSVLVCYCSEQYDEKSYIRDKKEYLIK